MTSPPAAQIAPPPAQKAAPPRVASLPSNVPPAVASANGELVSVNFAKGATELPPGIAPFLSTFVKKMKADTGMRLQLKGYAGGLKGSASQARRISLFRALSVRTYLMKQGVRSTRMDVRALGNKVGKGMPDRVDIEVKK
ncbi:MAG: OmpA family protein [Proteobacteria bacterium]|nr:OmpA family protein [Pseudomonadota bacterium]